MAWISDLSQKITNLLYSEDVMAMREGTFDFIKNQLQISGNCIGNHFKAAHANINQFYSSFEEKDSELADVENEDMELAAPERPKVCTDINTVKEIDSNLSFHEDSDSNDSISSEETGCSMIEFDQDFILKLDARNSGRTYVDDDYSDDKLKRYFSSYKSHYGKKITCEACAVDKKLTDHRECEHRAFADEALNAELNLSDGEISVPCTPNSTVASFESCDSDWEII